MAKRKIIEIDDEKCNGCGVCIPNCPEGALQIIDKKARLVSDLFCDGLGACIGHCPRGAIAIIERQAEKYDERKVMGNIIKQGANVIKAHLKHLEEHGQHEYLKQAVDFLNEQGIKNPLQEAVQPKHGSACSCPGAKVIDLRTKEDNDPDEKSLGKTKSQLRQWPVQINLVPAFAPYLNNADLLIAADCVAFAYADFHRDLLKGKTLLVGCPKLDNTQDYKEKLIQIFEHNKIESLTYAHMEVPCCSGLIGVIEDAITASAKKIPFEQVTISIKGEKLE